MFGLRTWCTKKLSDIEPYTTWIHFEVLKSCEQFNSVILLSFTHNVLKLACFKVATLPENLEKPGICQFRQKKMKF